MQTEETVRTGLGPREEGNSNKVFSSGPGRTAGPFWLFIRTCLRACHVLCAWFNDAHSRIYWSMPRGLRRWPRLAVGADRSGRAVPGRAAACDLTGRTWKGSVANRLRCPWRTRGDGQRQACPGSRVSILPYKVCVGWRPSVYPAKESPDGAPKNGRDGDVDIEGGSRRSYGKPQIQGST